jgi:hypothetical protein
VPGGGRSLKQEFQGWAKFWQDSEARARFLDIGMRTVGSRTEELAPTKGCRMSWGGGAVMWLQ